MVEQHDEAINRLERAKEVGFPLDYCAAVLQVQIQ